MRARSKMTLTWVEVSSTEVSVSIQFRDTMSTIANVDPPARVKWVASQIQIRFGSHTSHSGHGFFVDGVRAGRSGSTSP